MQNVIYPFYSWRERERERERWDSSIPPFSPISTQYKRLAIATLVLGTIIKDLTLVSIILKELPI